MTNSSTLAQACTQLAAILAETRQAFNQHQQPNRRTAALLCDHMLSLHKLLGNAQKLLTHISHVPLQSQTQANVGHVTAGVLMADDENIFNHAWQYLQVYADTYLLEESVWFNRVSAALRVHPAPLCTAQQIGDSLCLLIKAFHKKHNKVWLMQYDEETVQWYTYAIAQLPPAVVRKLHPQVAAQIA